jgi:hypothetical protein
VTGRGWRSSHFFTVWLEAFDLAAGLRMVGAGVGEPDPPRAQNDLQRDLPALTGGASEHRTVVRQQPGRITVLSCRDLENGVDCGGGEHPTGGAGDPDTATPTRSEAVRTIFRTAPTGDM